MTDSAATTPKVGRPRARAASSGDLTSREQILDASAELFAERGYAGTSTRAIADRVGIRQASVYYYFAGKEEILNELLEASVRPSLLFFDAMLRQADPGTALHALAAVDVATLLATRHNIGIFYVSPEVHQAPFDAFRQDRDQLKATYDELASSAAGVGLGDGLLGCACMQLVETVIALRQEGRVPSDLASRIADMCLRIVGFGEGAIAQVRPASRRLREQWIGTSD